MRKAKITAVDRASLVTWPLAWALVYYALTLRAVRGQEVHPIQAMFLVFGMMITAVVAAAAAGIWLGFLARRERRVTAARLNGLEVTFFSAVSGAIPMAVAVGLYELIYADSLGGTLMFALIAAAGVAGTLCAIATSGIVALRVRADSREHPPAKTGTT